MPVTKEALLDGLGGAAGKPIILAMHELPITEGILKIATDAAGGPADHHHPPGHRRAEQHRGRLGAVLFRHAEQGHAWPKGAALDFERRPATMTCWDCGRKFEVTRAAAIGLPALRQR